MALSQNYRQMGEHSEEIPLALTSFYQRQDISQNSDLHVLDSLYVVSFCFSFYFFFFLVYFLVLDVLLFV